MTQRRSLRLDGGVDRILAELGIAPARIAARGLRRHAEARLLAPAGLGTDNRDKMLTPHAARAWRRMQARAAAQGVALLIVSGFRSVEYQALLFRQKLARGMSLDEILRVNAPPGFSEHHTGKALDIGTPGCAALDEAFEATPAFAWLRRNAARHGFRLSYPRGNAQGYLYEPWHWRYAGTRRTVRAR